MKLIDVEHTEKFCGKPMTQKYSCHSNRFVLFDKHGVLLNAFLFNEKDEKTKSIEVLEIKESGYNDLHYFVGFPTTHVKLNIEATDKIKGFGSLRFGEVEEC